MQVIRKVIAPFHKYYSHVQEIGHPDRIFQNGCNYALLVRNNTNLALTGVRQPTNLESIVEVCSSMGLSSDDIHTAVTESPDLLKASPSQWEGCLSLLVNYGFTCKDCLGMVINYPQLLVTNKHKVTQTLELWWNSKLGDKSLLSVLKYNPHFLCIDAKQIEKRLPLLQSLTSAKKLAILLKKSPDLMFQNWKEVEKKVAYLKDVMKIEEVEIVKTAALSLPTLVLMTRHMFLERSGSFTPVKPTALPDEINTNPKLSQITDTSDTTFATKIAGLTLEEFEVFQEVFAEEIQSSEDSDSGVSDSDAEE